MPVKRDDADLALTILEKLAFDSPKGKLRITFITDFEVLFLDSPVGQAATRIANIFNSRLFNALLDIQVNFNTLVDFGPWIPGGTYLKRNFLGLL